MKKMKYIFATIATILCITSCDDDEWSTNPEYEHIYYVGFYKANVYSDKYLYNIAADGTSTWRYTNASGGGGIAWQNVTATNITGNISIDFHSQLKYTYDVTAYFYVTNGADSDLIAGTDYVVVDESDNTISLADGKYGLTWSQANKERRKEIRIKRLTTKTGVLKVNTLPAKPTVTDEDLVETTRNNITNQYEIRGLSHDWDSQTVTFE